MRDVLGVELPLASSHALGVRSRACGGVYSLESTAGGWGGIAVLILTHSMLSRQQVALQHGVSLEYIGVSAWGGVVFGKGAAGGGGSPLSC